MATKQPQATKQRVSTRTVVVSKAFRVLDNETRKELIDKRLQALEADNFVETEVSDPQDDEYKDEEDGSVAQKRKKMKSSLHQVVSKWAVMKPRNLERIVFEEMAESIDMAESRPSYESIAANPSAIPPVKLCSVCGYLGQYSCTRCGMRFCSVRCNNSHKETRCMKLSL